MKEELVKYAMELLNLEYFFLLEELIEKAQKLERR